MAVIRYLGLARDFTKVKSEMLEVENISQLLKEIERKHGKAARVVIKQSHILVNYVSISVLNGFRTHIGSEDVVMIIPVCGGG